MTDDKQPKDWREYEEKGVPILDFFLAVYDDRWLPEEMRLRWEQQVDFMAQVWLDHHPEREAMPTTYSSPHAPANLIPQDPLAVHPPAVAAVSNLVPACGHISAPDVSGKTHICFLPQSHEGAGIAHEDETMKWFRAQPKPFKKSAG